MKIENYKEKKLFKLEYMFANSKAKNKPIYYEDIKELLSQTIDELYELPEKEMPIEANLVEDSLVTYMRGKRDGWNSCIAEAERMRDLNIKRKR